MHRGNDALHQNLSLWDRKTCPWVETKARERGLESWQHLARKETYIYITLACSINRDVSASCLLEAIIVACIGEARPRPTWNPLRAVLVLGTCRHSQERASGFSTRSLFSEIRERRNGILARRQTEHDQQKSMTMGAK
jgi:hypothetical protein